MSLHTRKSHLFLHSILQPHNCQPTGERIPILGLGKVKVAYNSHSFDLTVLIVKGSGPNLLGRDWLASIRLDWTTINTVRSTTAIDLVVQKYPKVFSDKLGKRKNIQAKIFVQPNARPRFFRPRSVSYFMREKVNREIDRLQAEGIIFPVRHAEWAAPIVPVLKSDGQNVRICGDYRVTVNREAKPDLYPLPRIDDLFSNLAGGKVFSKLDLVSAYQQIELDKDSKQYTTITTKKGLFQYHRLPFGISAAPSIFQRIIENLLRDLPGVTVYLDDILISGATLSEHLANLELVLQRLQDAGLTLHRDKCAFALSSVEYLGHTIDGNGLHPSPRKIKAIQEAPEPKNLTELRSFVGLLNYYTKFIPNLSCFLVPFHRLMQKGVKWEWTNQHRQLFAKAKTLLQSSSLLTHFDPSKPLIVAADASPIGIGAVLSHKIGDAEQPIAFVSRSLATAESKYSQMEKEGLAIIFAVKKFHQFLHGRTFTIYSDHQP